MFDVQGDVGALGSGMCRGWEVKNIENRRKEASNSLEKRREKTTKFGEKRASGDAQRMLLRVDRRARSRTPSLACCEGVRSAHSTDDSPCELQAVVSSSSKGRVRDYKGTRASAHGSSTNVYEPAGRRCLCEPVLRGLGPGSILAKWVRTCPSPLLSPSPHPLRVLCLLVPYPPFFRRGLASGAMRDAGALRNASGELAGSWV